MDRQIPLVLSSALVTNRLPLEHPNPISEDAGIIICSMLTFAILALIVTIRDLMARKRDK